MKKILPFLVALLLAAAGLQAQNTITTLPYAENFDGVTGNASTSGIANHVLPAGWGWINNVGSSASYANYPSCYNSSTYVHSSPNALRFHTYNTTASLTTYSDQYAILPMIDVAAHPINTLQLDFKLRRYSNTNTYYVFLVVGVMSSPTDASTFVPIDTIETTSITYESFTVFFNNYTDLGQYIALKAPQPDNSTTHYNSFMVDDLVLDVIPTCPKPTNLAAVSNSATQNSLALSWEENGTAMEWEIEYGMPGFAEGTGTKVTANSNPFTITGLGASMFYDFRVRAVCSMADTSQYSNTITAQTQCGTITSLPYFQNFDAVTGLTTTTSTSSNLFQVCWNAVVTNYTSTSTSYKGYPMVYSNSTYSNSGLNALHFYAGTAHGNEIGVLPSIDVTTYPMNTLQVEFSAARQGTYAFHFDVGVMTDSSNASTFVPVSSISIPTTMPTQTYNTYLVDLSNYTGTGRFIAFRMLKPVSGSSTYFSGNIDDITVSTIPSCRRPMYVAVSEIMHDAVTVSWHPVGDEATWDVVVMPHGVAADGSIANTTFDTVYTMTGLTPSTQYDVYVRANCGTEVSAWAVEQTFTTRCAPIDTLPFVENFDNYTATTAVAAGVIPNCWLRKTNYTSPYPYIYSSQHASGTGSLYFYATSAYYSLAATPLLDLSAYNAGELMLNFKGLKSSSTAGYGRMLVGVMTDPFDLSTFTLVKEITTNDYDNLGAWRDFHISLPDHYTTPVSLAFYVPQATGTTYSFVDDVVLDYGNLCMPAEEVYVKNITGTSAKLVWRNPMPESNQYTIEYTISGQNNWSTPVQATGTNYILSGLEPSTSYDVRITPICNVGTPSPVVRTFSTTCLIPEHFQVGNGTAANTNVPIYTAHKHSYSQQLYRANEDLQNTQMVIDALAFQYNGSGSIKRNVDIYMMETSATTVSSWIDITTARKVYSGDVELLPNMSDGGWVTISLDTAFNYDGLSNLLVAIHNHDTTATNTVTSDKTFLCTSLSSMTRYINNTGTATYDPLNVSSLGTGTAASDRPNIRFIQCNTSTTCAPPTLTVSDVADEYAVVEWLPGYQETRWELEYKAASSPTWTNEGVLTTTNHTINNLLPSTDYQVRVRSICTDTSAWVTESFSTVCSSLATVPFFEGFEQASGNGAGNFVPCWVTQTNNTTAYPYTSSTAANVYSGTYGAYFNSTTIYYSLAATPRFDNSVRMDSLQIRFWAKKANAAYFIEVGIMNNPYDYNSFELIGVVSPDTISKWRELSLTTTGYTGNGHFVAFRVPKTAANVIYVDDINITYISPCARVLDVYANNITNTTADVYWVPEGENVTWYYTYGEKGTVDLSAAAFTITSDTMVTLTNLTGNTEYDVYVISECASGYLSDALKLTFRSACDQITTLPFFENFDGLGGTSKFPDCWSRLYMSSATTTPLTTSYPYSSSSYYTSAPYSMYFFNNLAYPQTYSIATLPEFAPFLPINTLQVNFDMRPAQVNYYMLVGVMTNPSDPATFVVVDTVHCTTTTFEHKSVSLASYTGNGQYLSFKSCGDGIYVDNINVEFAPQCNAPTNFTISDVHPQDVMLSWSPGGNETSWEIHVVPAGSTMQDAVPITVLTDTFYHLTNLDFGFSYEIYLRAVCPGGTGYSANVMETVSTPCDSISTLPYFMNFESEEGTTNGTVNNLPACWNYLNEVTASNYVGYPIVYRGTSYAHNSANSLRFYVPTGSNYGDQYAILPPINTNVLDMNDLQVSFYVKKYSTSYPHFLAIVGVMTDPTQISTFTPVDTVTCTSAQYELKQVYLNNYNGNGRYIAIRAPQILDLAYNQGCIDDIEINTIPVCLSVDNLQVNQIGIYDVMVSWTPNGNEDSWVVQYKPTTDSVWNEDFVTTTSAQITGLLPNTSYNIRVLADCNGFYSEPTTPIVVTTDCDVLTTLPFSTNFDNEQGYNSVTVTTNNLPSCWHYLNIGCSNDNFASYPIIYRNVDEPAYSGANTVFFYGYTSGLTTYGDQYAILPGLDVATYPISTLQLKFFARKYSPSYPFNLIVGVMSDVLDPTSFVPVDTVSLVSDEYEPFTVYFDSYTGSGNYVAMMVKSPLSSFNAGYVDNVELSVAPACRPVNNVHTTSVTSSTITIEWDANGSETNWIVGYRLFSDTAWMTQNVSGTPQATLTNLLSHSPYQIRVQADCGSGNLSEFASPLLVTTECNPITTLPFTEDFEGVQGSTTGTQNNLPVCWNHLSGTYSPFMGYPIVYSSGTNTNAHSGINSIRFYTTTGSIDYGDQYAILPQIDVSTYPIHTLQLSFWARQSSNSTSNSFVITVGVMDNPLDPTTFALIQTISPTDVNYANFTVDFSNYAGSGSYIALKVSPNSTSTTSNTGYVDDIEVNIAPVPCNTPTNVTASSIAPTSATISWTPGDAETSWNLQYKEASGSWSNSIPVTNNPMYVLTGLTDNTTYDVRVQAVCNAVTTSNWSDTAHFTTLLIVVPPTVTTNDATNIGQTTATLNGAITPGNETIMAQGFEWKATTGGTYTAVNATGTTLSYDLTGLATSTSYTFRAFATTASGTTYGAEKTFTTQQGSVVAPTVTTNDATNITQTTATLNGAVTAGSESITAQGFEWKETSAGTYTTVNATGTTISHDLTGLTPNTGYTFRAFATTASGTTYGAEKTFTTHQQQETCLAPTNLREGAIVKSVGYLFVEWDNPANASQWNLQYKLSSENDWNTIVVSGSPYYEFDNLEAYAEYNLRVQAICDADNLSDWSNILTATAQGVGIDDHTPDNSVTVYPNPTSGVVQIENGEWRMENVEVYDAYGKLLFTVEVNGNAAALDLTGYAKGTYFVKVTTEKGVVTKRVVKN